ncbi:hypothetical protein D7D52_27950 [Nocardia yunnanensis]|uniref:Uncharacterized protein n=1 Tax=Nocardia yunnanensis TaxID=2382165 RepID=A0A386ZIP3_9NOCA|nr:hypothetical protein [Nocardia yunnanensis]AYF77004.1 hypothetical protein D7D52_27950 [Nocardia yunnanensis]
MADNSGAPMTDAEIRQFFALLQRWCDTELDQFTALLIPTRYGDVYATFARKRSAEFPPELYERLPATWLGDTE